jgi:formylglycine-generating enzyme required for sulfatase activity
MPAGQTHQPWRERLRVPGYYDNPAYDNHPAIAISWWSTWAFAAWDGAWLPTSLEWEAAVRGPDGRLFPWGDDLDLDASTARQPPRRAAHDHLRGLARGT